LPALHRRVHSDSSYASAGDLRIHAGLGAGHVLDHVEVSWPSGRRERFDDLETGHYNDVVEGAGRPLDSSRP
jgi:hypothetical protein